MYLETKTYVRMVPEYYIAAQAPEDGKKVIDGKERLIKKDDYIVKCKKTGVEKIINKIHFETWYRPLEDARYVFEMLETENIEFEGEKDASVDNSI
jgi:hypothetical protein